jgi:hypothetical protein
VTDSSYFDALASIEPLPLLEEALELFQRCLTLQEYQYTEFLVQAESMSTDPSEVANEDGGVSMTPENEPILSEPPKDDRWATIVEPVTNDTLLDTLLAQLETLTTLCGLVNANAGRGLSWVEEYSTSLLTTKLPTYLASTDRETEAGLTRANFIAALADANFRGQRIEIRTYFQALEEAYSGLDLNNSPEGLVNKAEALISYNSSLRNTGFLPYENDNADSAKEISENRWQALTTALEALSAASKLPSAENLAKIHLTRGDVELLRFALGKPPTALQVAKKNGVVLVKNAEKFYRGAKTLAVSMDLEREILEAKVKEALAAGIGGNVEGIKDALKLEAQAKGVLEDAFEEGLVTIEEFKEMGIS